VAAAKVVDLRKNKVGYGHLYRARFKSFPVETDDHFYTLVRYVKRNLLIWRQQ
jgi:putative transposase